MFQYRWHLLATVAAIYVVQKVVAYKRLSHIKGPWIAAWSEFPHSKATFVEKAYEFYRDANKTYGT